MSIAILGAECSGKTTLMQNILAYATYHKIAMVGIYEGVRGFVQRQGQAPQNHAQQYQLALDHFYLMQRYMLDKQYAYVLADTTPWLTQLYSQIYLGDDDAAPMDDMRLWHLAWQQQRKFDISILLKPDVKWVADGVQRDGPAMRSHVFQALKNSLDVYGLPYIELSANEAFTYIRQKIKPEHAPALLT